MDFTGYLAEVRRLHANNDTTEHSFRPALARLFGSIDPELTVINEPQHIAEVGAPDFVFYRGDIAIGWCEAKDIGRDIRKFAKADYSHEQKQRYRQGLPNLIYTNGLDFEFIRDGESVDFITIADLIPTLPPRLDNFARLENRLRDFAATTPRSITGSRQLAEAMAGKAAIIKDVMGRALLHDLAQAKKGQPATDLISQYEAFRKSLIHDIQPADFADIYAETIAYGLFAARLHSDRADSFDRAGALELLPKSNPFLRALFVYIAGPDLDERLRRPIDEFCQIFLATELHKVMKGFGRSAGRTDPFVHFYEDFLARYNPKKRKARGVWYTPAPVVSYIVRAVDQLLVQEFGLADGLADTSRITIDRDTGPKGKLASIRKDVHRVQILDPATGTGTFLAEAVQLIAERVRAYAPGGWSAYVEQSLIPRLHGFELLMASYAMCHLKLDMALEALGYRPAPTPPRLGVYLTNSLEEGERVEQTLFAFGLARAIAEESRAASTVKRQTPIMVMIGNPPYSGESANKSAWITKLMEAYKKEPGGKVKLQERNPKWLNDDYVKFLRLAEHMIDNNGEGILGFITNHGYLDNPTFRGMRWHLLASFDRIYVLDLHGNAKKKEVAPDGRADRNVFDIQQGVAIILAVRHKRADKDGGEKPLAELFHGELWGERAGKYQALAEGTPATLSATPLPPRAPDYLFVPRDYGLAASYEQGFAINELMPVNSVGIVTARDSLTIDIDRDALWQRVQDFAATDAETLRTRYQLGKDAQDWQVQLAKNDVIANLSPAHLVPIAYRPFDTRWTYYTGTSRGFQCRPRDEVMRHLVDGENLALGTSNQPNCLGSPIAADPAACVLLCPDDFNYFRRGGAYTFPLYAREKLDDSRRINFEPALYARIRKAAGLSGSTAPAADGSQAFRRATGDARSDEVKLFDYIYAVLHCPAYREAYGEFLKSDFPRIPLPPSPAIFADLSAIGEQLRRLHLLEPAAIGATPYAFEGDGSNKVEKPSFARGRVWINERQSFADVPEAAWDFWIGGYQPAQKWLKDRKGRQLSFDDIRHYQRIIKVLQETGRIMAEIHPPLATAASA